VWWEGMTDEKPVHLIDWKGKDWTPDCGNLAAHPNARFTAPAGQCPSIDPAWQDPDGVPISAFVFGGRISKNFPLVFESYNWEHGVYLAATMGSEATAAAVGQAAMRRDPMAMLPFCGYNMGNYWKHWLHIGRQKVATPPRIFRVNWFRKDENGKFIWPGFGENMRALEWIVDRVHGRVLGIESPLGWVPRYEEINWDGLDFSEEKFYEIMNINKETARTEAAEQEELFTRFGEHLPREMELERELLLSRLYRSPDVWDLKSVA
ncbi:MAG: phosphoenolpyruvate carboxykinase domain-containing protein, partial [Methylococcales bacterium]